MVALAPDLPACPFRARGNGSTLVLDMDETLLHSKFSLFNQFEGTYVRPGAESFLRHVKSMGFEVVVFTAAEETYANAALSLLPCDCIDQRLFRQHTSCILRNGCLIRVKDLNALDRPVDRVLIVDNLRESFYFHPENGIQIFEFKGEEFDCQLLYLLYWLQHYLDSRLTVPAFISRNAAALYATVARRPRGVWRPHFPVHGAALDFTREILGDAHGFSTQPAKPAKLTIEMAEASVLKRPTVSRKTRTRMVEWPPPPGSLLKEKKRCTDTHCHDDCLGLAWRLR